MDDKSISSSSTAQVTDLAGTDAGKTAIDPSHSFYLHPSDSLGMLLVNIVFDGKGYGGWRREILIALLAKNKVGFIDGSISQPKISSDSFKSWARCNDMVISWLLNALSKEIAESVLYSKISQQI
ncbi:uncharacterized protein [Nicotiana sylvestris]|uniref:uncharacterized protein n=1 Tax=Nicotiana sylvestris TaxID=4096 RepID=UPI00388C54A0